MPQFRTLKPGARILSHQFPISGVRPIRTESVVSTEDGDRHVVRLWVAPLPEASPPPP